MPSQLRLVYQQTFWGGGYLGNPVVIGQLGVRRWTTWPDRVGISTHYVLRGGRSIFEVRLGQVRISHE